MRRVFTLCLLFIGYWGAAQNKNDAGDFDALRVENEIKLSVPNKIADSVWAYLQKEYSSPNSYLKAIDSTFSCTMAIDSFIDQYFDNEAFDLLEMESGVRYRTRYVLTNPGSKKNGKELMQVKINDIGPNKLNRGEYKYKIKHYEKKYEPLDMHPFLGIVKRKHRDNVTKRLKEYGIDSENLEPTVKIVQIRKRIYLRKANKDFATITLDNVKATYRKSKASFTELELELNEIGYTKSDAFKREEMEDINSTIKSHILDRFPTIEQDQTPKYNKAAVALKINDTSINERTVHKWVLSIMGLAILIIVIRLASVKKRRK